MKNRLRAVILDWAGTTVDHGSLAPIAALQSVFAEAGVNVEVSEARAFMGLAKKDHIRKVLALPRVAAAWESLHGALPGEEQVSVLYRKFIPRQLDCLPDYSRVIAGVPEAVGRMRSRGFKIGATTGYTRAMLDFLLGEAVKQGFAPDCSVCPEDAGGGRPEPWMCFQNAILLQVYPLESCVKIGDTPSDIEEGRNAGMWTIGIARTGNQVGLSERDWHRLSDAEQTAALARAREDLRGAHYISDSVSECDAILANIDTRLANGDRP